MNEKERLKSDYQNTPPLRFIKDKFFSSEHKNLFENKKQMFHLQYALQLLWCADVIWIENMRFSKSRIQELIIEELTADDLARVVHQYRLTYKNPWETSLIILIVLINRLISPDVDKNKYEIKKQLSYTRMQSLPRRVE